jgi:hypothetical protein
MFEKLAKFRQLQSWHQTPVLNRFAPANDNRPHARDTKALRGKKPRLVCRWLVSEATNQLECRWEIEGSDGRDRSSPDDGRSAALHKSFVKLSQAENPGWLRLTSSLRPNRPPEAAPSDDSLSVLPTGHLPMPSDGDGGRLIAIANSSA